VFTFKFGHAFTGGCHHNAIARDRDSADFVAGQTVRSREESADQLEVATGRIRGGSGRVRFRALQLCRLKNGQEDCEPAAASQNSTRIHECEESAGSFDQSSCDQPNEIGFPARSKKGMRLNVIE
jgi:hypothetical protein